LGCKDEEEEVNAEFRIAHGQMGDPAIRDKGSNMKKLWSLKMFCLFTCSTL